MKLGTAERAVAFAGAESASRGATALRIRRMAVLGVALLATGLTVLAFWLRLRFAQNISMSVDEFTSLWAARRVLDTGVPEMLSGAYYLRGLLLSYAVAALGEFAGLSRIVARTPSLVLGAAAVPLVLVMGWRAWNVRVGSLAALGLALFDDAIRASSRVRFYAPALFFIALTVWVHFETLQGTEKRTTARSWWMNIGWSLAFACAIFLYEGAAAIYPALVLAAFWWRGWRWFRNPPVLAAQLICLAAIGARFGLEAAGAHSYLLAMQENKPILDPFSETAVQFRALVGKYLQERGWVWTLGSGIAIAVAIIALIKTRFRLDTLPTTQRATVVYALPLLIVVAAQVLVVGHDYGVDRQVSIVMPFWLLLGVHGFDWILERSTRRESVRWAATAVAAVAISYVLLPIALRIADRAEEGYEPAFAWLAQQLQPGDVTLSPQPSACAVMLPEPCDYYLRSIGFEAYLVEKEGRNVDLWSGAPLLATTAELAQVVQESPRTWIVIDGKRLGRRHSPEFVELMMRQFDSVFSMRGVSVLRADKWNQPRTYTLAEELSPALRMGPLLLERMARGDPLPGDWLPVRLMWRVDPGEEEQVNTSVQLAAADGARLTQDDGPPAEGFVETMDEPGNLLPDTKLLRLPDEMAAGRYRLEVVTYEVLTDKHIAGPTPFDWFWIGPSPTPLPHMDVAWDSGIRLVGAEIEPEPWSAGATPVVRLSWSADDPLAEDYVMFVQLLDPDGHLVAQADREPEGGFYPTSAWESGESVQDAYLLELPATLPPGSYSLIAGMYRRDTLARTTVSGDADVALLRTIEVK